MSLRTRALALACATAVAVVALGVPASFAAARSATVRASDSTGAGSDRRTVVATGIARVRGTPDVLRMTIGVSSRGGSVGEALDRNTGAARRVTGVLVDGGVDERDIQTTNFSIGPVFDNGGQAIAGYQVSNLLVVSLRDLATAGRLIDQAVEAGGDDAIVRNVSFDIDDTSDLIASARTDAVKRARTQATQLAEAAGVQLGDVVTITELSSDPGPVDDLSVKAFAGDAASAVPIEPGSRELAVVVSVVFSIR